MKNKKKIILIVILVIIIVSLIATLIGIIKNKDAKNNKELNSQETNKNDVVEDSNDIAGAEFVEDNGDGESLN